MAHLTWDNIKSNTLEYKRRKTGDVFTIELHLKALEIIAYYRKAKLNPKTDYVFPVFNESHKTSKSQDYRYKKIRKEYNSALKTIASKCGIDVQLTSYVARHSFAHALKTSGQSMTLIKEALGHESEKMTEVYTSELDTKVMSEVINNTLL